MRAESRIGVVTSGGVGHSVDRSLAMALVQAEDAEIGTEVSTHVAGTERAARVAAPSPDDPEERAMRG